MALNQSLVSSLYVSLFGRVSEGDGNSYWLKKSIDDNLNMAQIADNMLDSFVAKQYFGNNLYDNFKFINFIYENTLNKSAYSHKGIKVDSEGVYYWTNLLNTKQFSKGQIVSEMIKAIYNHDNIKTDAGILFKNKVLLSNATANLIKSANPNKLEPFIDAVKSVKSDSTESDISNILQKLSDKVKGYTFDNETLIVHKDTVGMITVDQIPRNIQVDGFSILRSKDGGRAYTQKDLIYYLQNDDKKSFETGYFYNYKVNDTRYLYLEKGGSKNSYSPDKDLLIRVLDMPKSMNNYKDYTDFGLFGTRFLSDANKNEITFGKDAKIPSKPIYSSSPFKVDKTENTKGYYWSDDVLIVYKNTTGVISIENIPNAISINGQYLDTTTSNTIKSYTNVENLLKAIVEGVALPKYISSNEGDVFQAQVKNNRYVYINKDGYQSNNNKEQSFDYDNDLMIEIVGLKSDGGKYTAVDTDSSYIYLV
ncbi:hypothetical protein [Campylobacter sp. RM16190]|uniref:hypothetical protein n=1 Tax=Campylobacter sp. RM16190 TaxID=1705727 RepID=UPI001474FB42|nr:hypothetical protein [Campylobacter sp. RM16190]